MAEPGEVYADKRHAGRWVEILSQRGPVFVVETVRAADDARSSRAVGRQTAVDSHNLQANFIRVPDADLIAEGLPVKTAPQA